MIDTNFVDGGGNSAINNSDCNGIFVQNGSRCIGFLASSRIISPQAPTVAPQQNSLQGSYNIEDNNKGSEEIKSPLVPTETLAPREGVGYFNYNMNDNRYGPSGWGSVRNNPEYMRYLELSNTLKRSLRNKCNWRHINQSPIDLCENKINKECEEYHQTRTHSGNINIGDRQVKAEILPR